MEEYSLEIPLEQLVGLDSEYSIEEHQHIAEGVELVEADVIQAAATFKVTGVTWKDIRSYIHHKGSYYKRTLASIKKIVIHHSATVTGSAEAYANYHVDTLGWPGIGYHIVVEQDGTVKYCNDLTSISYHVGNANSYCVGICMTGDFSKNKPTAKQWASVYKVIEQLRSYLPNAKAVSSIIGHQECPGYAWKPCPSLDMDSMRGQVNAKTYKAVANKFNNDQVVKVVGGGAVASTPAKATTTKEADKAGKITVLVNDLAYYGKADWNNKVGRVNKGEVFTVVKELTVDGAKMYKLKSGNYITASTKYVKFSK